MSIGVDVRKTIRWSGRYFRLAGKGKAPASWVYTDVGSGLTIELFSVKIVFIDGNRAFAAAESNQALGNIRIESGDFRVGDHALVGPLTWRSGHCHAEMAWRIGYQGNVGYVDGTLVEWHNDRGFGRLLTGNGESIFVHVTAFNTGIVPSVGIRYAFQKEGYGTRLTARDVRNSR
jgi:hypothetical protein